MHWYFLISSYYLTVEKIPNGHSLTTLKSVEVTQCSGSFKWGGPSLISSYYLTVLNGHSLTTLKSVEVTQCSGSFKWGGPSLISSYYLTVLNGHSLTTLKSVEVTQCSGSFKWGGPSLISSYYLTVSNGCSLTVLKSIEVTQCSGSFEWGGEGSFDRFTLNLPILSSLAISCFASQVFSYYIRKTYLECIKEMPLPKTPKGSKTIPWTYWILSEIHAKILRFS